MTQPPELRSPDRLKWSAGTGTGLWAMFQACVAGDLAAVEALVAGDPSLVRAQFRYRKPLHFAVRENRLDVAAFLLDRDPDPFGLEPGDSLVQVAKDRGYDAMERLLREGFASRFGASEEGEAVAERIRVGDLEGMVALLDARPERVHAGDRRSNRPVHWAVMTRRPVFLDALLDRGADLGARRADGARPIHLTNGDYHFRGWRDVPKDHPTSPEEMYRHLRERGAVVDLAMACATGDLARVRELLDRDPASVNRVSDYAGYYVGCGAPIRNAAAKGHLEVVRLLLGRGADPNLPEEGIAPDGHAVHAAAANGHHAVVECLLALGGNPNAPVESSADTLSRALMNGDRRMVDLLCAHGAARPMHLMAYYNDLQTAAAVLAVDPRLADDPEALVNAAGEGHEAFVRLLLRHCPDLPSRAEFPSWSVGSKTLDLDRLLFRHGLDARAANWLGVTALHELAGKGDVEKAALFLEHGADIDARDEELRSTPLGWAAKHGRLEMVAFLLARGARTNLPDDPPWATPLAWAERRGHAEVAARLRAHGAR